MQLINNSDVLTKDFYERDTLEVAPELLGCLLHRRLADGSILSGIIVETEAYKQNDPACHAYRGKTPRSMTLFGECGLAYIYFIYGMYHCFNVVTEPKDTAGAVLIRALEPISPLTHTHGPSRLCKSMQITKDLNETDLTNPDNPIWITFSKKIPKKKIITTTRIGISVATENKWRFYIKDNPNVSVK